MTQTAQGGASDVARRGLMLVLSSPSGAGKTTLSRKLLAANPDLHLSVSVTTRQPRRDEVDGQDYTFVDAAAFERLKAAGELLEWAEVFGRFYATPKGPVLAALAAGQDMLFDIDWQGARQLKAHLPADVVSVFILPPDGKALERRLKARGQDSAEAMARRMSEAATEISHWGEYDYVIVNSEVDESFAALAAVLAAERRRRERLIGMEAFIAGLLADL